MDSAKAAVTVVFSLAFVGCIAAVPIAAFPQSTIRSKSKLVRLCAKSSIFALCFFVSFVLTAIPLAWIVKVAEIQMPHPDLGIWMYLITCIPMAIVLYLAHMAIVSAIYRLRS